MGKTLADFDALLTPENWRTWMGDFHEKEGTLGLPRFSLEWRAQLQDTLKMMGMPLAFGDLADFSGMFPPDDPRSVLISRVIHAAKLDVNEEGTEAAGATIVEMFPVTEEAGPFSMWLVEPFFLAIVDNTTGTILFMGAVHDPS